MVDRCPKPVCGPGVVLCGGPGEGRGDTVIRSEPALSTSAHSPKLLSRVGPFLCWNSGLRDAVNFKPQHFQSLDSLSKHHR